MACSATYSVSQNDVDAGAITNTGTVVGIDPNGEPVADEDTFGMGGDIIIQNPAIEVVKLPDFQQVALGDEAFFTITVTNIGNVTLYGISVSDPLAPLCDFEVETLPVGGSAQHNCAVTITADLLNVATVTGAGPQGQQVVDSDDAFVDALPQINVTKSTNLASVPPTGGYVEFVVQVTNLSGANDALSITSIVDTPYGDILDPGNPNIFDTDCAAVVVAPAATYTCNFTVFLPGGEVGDLLTDEITVAGADEEGNAVADSDSAEIVVAQGPGVGTPGYWKTHPEVWNGDTSDDVMQPDVLYPVDSNGDGVIDGQDVEGILIGDWNLNGICDEPFESCIFQTLEEADYILDASSQTQGKDKRFTLGRALVATWLNIIGGNDLICIEDSVNAGIAWLKKWTGGNGPDELGDGRIVTIDGEGNVEIDPDKVKGPAWGQEGELIYLALDCYNNTGGGCAIDRDTREVGTCEAYTYVHLDGEILDWNMPPMMSGVLFRVVRGDLGLIAATDGDFSSATLECLADAQLETELAIEDDPAPGTGHWFLVGVVDNGSAVFDTPWDSQVGSRDEEIAASGVCP
jgi:uncharacterized repeat protein (TIGR01451 family)